MIELLTNTKETLTVTFPQGDATGNVLITVVDQDGTVIVNAATATHGATGVYTYDLAPQSQPAWLTVTWTGTFGGVAQSITTGGGQADGTAAEVQVAGGHLFSVADLRAFGDKRLASSVTYPDQVLIDKRAAVTNMFEDFCNVAFVNRYGRATLDGTMKRTLWLPNQKVNKLRAVTISGVALSAGELALISVYPNGKLDRVALWPPDITTQNIVVSYEHGWISTPEDISRAAMLLARHELITPDYSDRMTSYTNDVGTTRLAMPDAENPTGLPSVDTVLRRYANQMVGP